MTYITVCDARHPVPIDIKEGNSISMTSMSLIYDFYNINKPQEIVKFVNNSNTDDKPKIFVEDFHYGIDFCHYYEKYFAEHEIEILVDKEKVNMINLFATSRLKIFGMTKDDLIDSINVTLLSPKFSIDKYKTYKLKEYEILKDVSNSNTTMISKFYYKNLHELTILRYRILKHFNSNIKFDFINIYLSDIKLYVKYPKLDSGIDDYVYELIISGFPYLYKEEKKHKIKLYNEYMMLEFINDTEVDTLDNILNENIRGSNKIYYHSYIKEYIKIYDPERYFIDTDNMEHVYNFLRVNNYVHGILDYLKNNEYDHYEMIMNNKEHYHHKGNIKNKILIDLIDRYYGGDSWKCFTREFVKDKIDYIANLYIKKWVVNSGFFNLVSLLSYHFKEVIEFDYNKYMVVVKKDSKEEESVSVVRPVGSDSYESHGELYDLLWSKDSGRRFPDIIGSMKHINVHCEQINGLESVFIDHDGNQRHNKMIGTIKINPTGSEFFGTRNEYDNERRIYFKLASPVKHITHLNFYFTDCDGKRITLNGPVLLNLVIQ